MVMEYIANSSLTIVLLGIVLFLARNYINRYIAGFVNKEFQKELETFKAELKQKQIEQEHFHNLLMQSISRENKELKHRKMLAIDHLWKSFLAYKTFSASVKSLSTMNVEEFKKRSHDPKIQAALKIIPGCDIESIKRIADDRKEQVAEESRPWLTYKAWSLYTVYIMLIYYVVFQVENIKSGGDLESIFDKNKLLLLIQNALPELNVTQINNAQLGYIHDSVELELLKELKNMIEDNEDLQAIERATSIYKIKSEIEKNLALKK